MQTIPCKLLTMSDDHYFLWHILSSFYLLDLVYQMEQPEIYKAKYETIMSSPVSCQDSPRKPL